MPAALRRAPSISPGGLFGSGLRASGTGAPLLARPWPRLGSLGAGLGSVFGVAASRRPAWPRSAFCFRRRRRRRRRRRLFEHQLGQARRQLLRLGAVWPAAAAASSKARQTSAQTAARGRRMRRKRASSSTRSPRAAPARGTRPRAAARRSCLTAFCVTANDTSLKLARAAGDHHLAQQAVRDVLVAHDRDRAWPWPGSPRGSPGGWHACSSSAFSGAITSPRSPAPRRPWPPCGRRPGCRCR